MPKYHKTTKVELWRTADDWQDNTGSWHAGRPTQIATLWACFKGRDYSLLYQSTGRWAKPLFDITVTRPKFTRPGIGDHIRHDGKFYIVRQVNDLTGQVGRDMTLTCELDVDYKVEA